MHILIAPNAFKNSLTADMAARTIRDGLQQSKWSCSTAIFPIGDGGDGTAALLVDHLQGKMISQTVHDPIGREINAGFGLVDNDQTAIIELADASGLRLLQKDEYDPLHTTTSGTGELIKQALEMQVKKIILCIGGSATVDGGSGILQALGAKFLDEKNLPLTGLPVSLINLAAIDTTQLPKAFSQVELVVLCDVENKLLGENGSAAVFGPQKGASKENVQQLESGLSRLRDVVFKKTGKDMAAIIHGGAAGGVAAGLHCILDAKLVNGIDYFLEITGFEKALEPADLLITGEGSIDEQTLLGKGPFGVASRAKKRSIPVIGFAGMVPLKTDRNLQEYFDVLFPIGNEPTDIKTAMQNSRDNLFRSAKSLGDLLSLFSSEKQDAFPAGQE